MNFTGGMRTIFETERLRVRELLPEDLAAMYRMQRNPEVMQYTARGTAMSEAEVRAELEDLMVHYDSPTMQLRVWCVCVKALGDELAGTCALQYNEHGEYEIGYRFGQEFWGEGYGRELCRGLVKYCFEALDMAVLYAYVYVDNVASVRIVEGVGFQLVRTFYSEEQQCLDSIYRLDNPQIVS
jgi:[ribosomal protein S5]-alanine N-acetyltransferase